MGAFAEQIRRVRKASHYPRTADFAARIGVTQRAVQLFEHGDSVPKAESLAAIISAAGLDPAQAARLRDVWARERADRDGVSIAARDAHQLDRLTDHVAAEAIRCVRERGAVVPNELHDTLRSRLRQVVERVLAPPARHEAPR